MQHEEKPQEAPHRYGTPEDLDDDEDFYDSPMKQAPEASKSPSASMQEPSTSISSNITQDAQLQLPGLGSFSNGAKPEARNNDKPDVAPDHATQITDTIMEDQEKEDTNSTVKAQEVSANGISDMVPANTEKTAGDEAKAMTEEEFLLAGKAMKGDEQAEWQLDSDPESSDDSDSTDSSDSDDSSSEDEDYALLSPEEQARILMAEDGGEDGDAPIKTGNAPKTQNEQPSEDYKKPDITITPEMQITLLGTVMNMVGNIIVIVGNTSGEYQVLESGSVVCLKDRSVVGLVSEPMGPVQGPLYSVGFPTADDIAASGIERGTEIYYVNQLSTYVFTQPLQAFKGTDASNFYDEEVDANEMEFSDDEAEAEYKRSRKQAKKAARDGNQMPPDGADRSVGSFKKPKATHTGSLNYDDEGDDLYTPLARPSDFSAMVGAQAEHVQENWKPSSHRGGRGGAQRGRPDRERGNRRDKGGRGRGQSSPDHSRDDHRNRQRNHRGEPHQSNQDRKDWQQPSPSITRPYQKSSPIPQLATSNQGFSLPPPPPNFPSFPKIPFSNMGQLPFPFPPPPPPIQAQNSNLPTGAYINPNFFRNQQLPQTSPPNFPQQWVPPPPPQPTQVSPQQAAQGQFNLQQLLAQLSQSQSPPPPQPQYSSARSPESDAAFSAAQQQLDILRRLSQNPGSP